MGTDRDSVFGVWRTFFSYAPFFYSIRNRQKKHARSPRVFVSLLGDDKIRSTFYSLLFRGK